MINRQTIDISTATIFRFILIILGLVFLYLIRDILLILFIAIIVAAAVDGPVDWLARHKVRRVFGATIIYLGIFLFLALFVYLVFPPLAGQIKILAHNLPQFLDSLGSGVKIIEGKIGPESLKNILENISNQLSGAASNIFGTAINIFGGIFSAAMILVISVYLVIQEKGIKKFLAVVTPANHQAYILDLVERIQSKLGAWLRGQLLLMLIIGILVYIGLSLLKIKFALTLALLAGLLEIITYIGPVLSATPAAIFAFFQMPILGLLVVALFVLIQQLENYLILPLVMKKAIGLNPLVIIVSMLIGGQLAGVMGIIIAVPLAAAISVVSSDFFGRKT